MYLQCGSKQFLLSTCLGFSLGNITDWYGKYIYFPFGLRITHDSNIFSI
jgi:hypothetical protein